MSRTYRICDRGGLLTIGVDFSLLGCAVAAAAVLQALGVPPFDAVGGFGGRNALLLVLGLAIGGVLASLGVQHLARRPWMITVDPPGIVAFHRAVGVTRVRVVDVVRLELKVRKVGVEDDDNRVLALEHQGGTITVPHFPEIDAFVALIRAVNPRVWVTGSWDRGGRP